MLRFLVGVTGLGPGFFVAGSPLVNGWVMD